MYGYGLALFLLVDNVLDRKMGKKIVKGTDSYCGQRRERQKNWLDLYVLKPKAKKLGSVREA